MNYQSTSAVTPPSAWCAVYDPTTGEVVHIHGFTGFDVAADSDWARARRRETALAHVRAHVRKNAKGLEVAHGDPKRLPRAGDRFSVNVKTGKLVVTPGVASMDDFLKAGAKDRGKR